MQCSNFHWSIYLCLMYQALFHTTSSKKLHRAWQQGLFTPVTVTVHCSTSNLFHFQWVLIWVNFDPVQEIGPKVGGGHSFPILRYMQTMILHNWQYSPSRALIGNLNSLQQTVGDSTPGLPDSVEDKVQWVSSYKFQKRSLIAGQNTIIFQRTSNRKLLKKKHHHEHHYDWTNTQKWKFETTNL